MARVTRLVLDVLKPHEPSVLEFAQAIAELGADYRVSIEVRGVDRDTEDIVISIEADMLDVEPIDATIRALGGSLHSMDCVEVVAGGSVSEER